MSEWCGPTAELPNPALAKLLHRSRRPTKRTDPSAPLKDPWFEDSQPITVDADQPVALDDDRPRRARTAVEKITALRRPSVYPIYRSKAATIVWSLIVLGVIGAIAAYFIV